MTRKAKPFLLAGLIAVIGLVIFLGANAHLFYVAFNSQPECVPHLKSPSAATNAYRAAKSSC